MIEPELLTEVPAALKRLAKQVVRGFYGVEHALALDVLIRNPCVREEDMLELLKFDRKQLRSVLNTLKADKFVKCRMRVETAPDGKTTRHNYYFINYRFYGYFRLFCLFACIQLMMDVNTQTFLGYWSTWSSINWITCVGALRPMSETTPTGPPSVALAASPPSRT